MTLLGVPGGAVRITDTPPSRSSPSTGFKLFVKNPANDDTTKIATKMTLTHRPLVRFKGSQSSVLW